MRTLLLLLAAGILSLAADGARLGKEEVAKDGAQLSPQRHAGVRRQVDLPPADKFYRKANHRVVVLGDYVYIDGGEYSQIINETSPLSQKQLTYAANKTLSISLTNSWTASTAPIVEISRPIPGTRAAAIWSNASASSFYVWGGAVLGAVAPAQPQLWRFTADNSGSGRWSTAPEATSNVVGIIRNEQMGYARAGDGVFLLGGYATYFTDPSIYPAGNVVQAQPGLVTYNTSTNRWSNDSAAGLGRFGTFHGGVLEHVPPGVFGNGTGAPRGVIFALGGGEVTVQAQPFGSFPPEFFDFGTLKFFDVGAKKWYSQETTGVAPSPRRKFCTVGVQGPNGTYEIFLFGGVWDPDPANPTSYDDMHVLSLPAFAWFRADAKPNAPRALHSCAVIGKRQMLSVGGIAYNKPPGTEWGEKDPWPQGMGVFDLTALSWSSNYNAKAGDYVPPNVVVEWYKTSKLNDVRWSSNEVKGIFIKAESTNGTSDNQNNSSNNNNNNSSSTNLGAIIGGTIGGLVGLCLIAVGVIYLLLRRRRRRNQAAAAESHRPQSRNGTGPVGMSPAPYGWYDPSKKGQYRPVEMQGHSVQELQSPYHAAAAGELPGHSPAVELPASPLSSELYTAESVGNHPLNGSAGGVSSRPSPLSAFQGRGT